MCAANTITPRREMNEVEGATKAMIFIKSGIHKFFSFEKFLFFDINVLSICLL